MPSLAVVFVGFFHIWLTFITVPSSCSQFSMFSGVTACWLQHKEIPCHETAFESCGPYQKTNLQPAPLPHFSAVQWFSPSVRTRLWERPSGPLCLLCVSCGCQQPFSLRTFPGGECGRRGLSAPALCRVGELRVALGLSVRWNLAKSPKSVALCMPFPSFKGRSKTCFGLHLCWGALNERRSISYFRERRPLHLLIAVARPRGHRRPNWVMGQSS